MPCNDIRDEDVRDVLLSFENDDPRVGQHGSHHIDIGLEVIVWAVSAGQQELGCRNPHGADLPAGILPRIEPLPCRSTILLLSAEQGTLTATADADGTSVCSANRAAWILSATACNCFSGGADSAECSADL
jgi:hypothetical protein